MQPTTPLLMLGELPALLKLCRTQLYGEITYIKTFIKLGAQELIFDARFFINTTVTL
jgi:hypothetical protein